MKQSLITAAAALIIAAAATPALAGDDFGLWTSIGATKKINSQWSVGAEAELRLCDNWGAVERWAVGASAAYKPTKYIKLEAGYKFIDAHRTRRYLSSAGNYKWLPYYWSPRHRFYAGVTGTLPVGNFEFSLRERWQYTYRPEVTTPCWNFGDDATYTSGKQDDDKAIDGTGKNVLRSRLQAAYKIPRSGVEPYVSAELYTTDRLDKVRYTAGVEWKINRQHALDLFYRYQDVHVDTDEPSENTHALGISYKFKF